MDGCKGTASRTVDEQIGDRVREFRQAKGMSLDTLGSLTGVTYQQIQKYERGINRISASTLIRISDALGVIPSALLDDLGNPASPEPEVEALAKALHALSPDKRALVKDLVSALS